VTRVGVTCGGEWWGNDVFREVEKVAFDSIWTGEHIVFHRPILESVSVVAALAAITERVDIGMAAIMLPLRQPTILAKELSSIDAISGGRLVVTGGVGGDYPKEFEACGIPMARRGRRTTETVEIMRRYWSGEPFSYHGEIFDLSDVSMDPVPPTPGGPRIWLAGRSDASIRRAVLHGDGYMPYMFTPEQCADAWRRLRGAAEELGHPLMPGFTMSALIYVSLQDDEKYARRLAVEDLSWRYNQPFDRLVEKYCVYGGLDRVLTGIRAYVDAGVCYPVLQLVRERGALEETVARYGEEIVPAVHNFELVNNDT
jgi:alkanesulfonate monooxygenase SsuD/methylene tetrahydromethanopterin reductase-like flavin-dependent oxidoreductase (luciferase family)